VIEFLQYNFKVIDIPLSSLQFNFMDQYNKFNLVQKKVESNTAMKYCQSIKEVIDRAVANEWMNTNIFSIFSCTYIDPKHDWITWQEMNTLIGWTFDLDKLNIIRDIIVFCSFTGLSYQEVYTLSPTDIITGVDGKQWIAKDRQKTDGDETLPMLPIAEQLLEKYQSHPKCIKKGRMLPVPTNQEFNRCCKEIARQTGIAIDMRSHKNRYFFANEVTYNQGVPLKTVSKMLSHKSIKTTEIYVRANRQNISENMAEVQRKLFNKDGELKAGVAEAPQQAKVITLRVV
jgi:site-specific recombinase XerD